MVCSGDFNIIIFLLECNRGIKLSLTMRRSTEIIVELELCDLPLLGAPLFGVRG